MLHTQERPMNYDAVLGQDFVVENLRKQSKANKFAPLYIFEGNKGSGKTTVARIMAKAANCENKDERGNPCCKCSSCISIQNGIALDYIEIDGASNNGVNEARSVIENAGYVPANSKRKVIVIDEAHMLSNAAFNAFLKTFEEPPEYCIFIMATTECHKIPDTVRSRALKYTFNRIDSTVIMDHIKEVANKYQVTIEDDAAALIAKKARGAMRDALGELEKCLLVGDTITAKDVMYTCGIEDADTLLSLFGALCAYNKNSVFEQVEALYKKGRDMNYVLEEILDIVTDVLKYSNCNDDNCIINTKEYILNIKKICKSTAGERLSFLADNLMELKKELRIDASKSNVLIHMAKMCDTSTSISALLERIKVLEAAVLSKNTQEIRVIEQHAEPCVSTISHAENSKVSETKDTNKEEVFTNSNTNSTETIVSSSGSSNTNDKISSNNKEDNSQGQSFPKEDVSEHKPEDVSEHKPSVKTETKNKFHWTSTTQNLGKTANTNVTSSVVKESVDIPGTSVGEDGYFHFDKKPVSPSVQDTKKQSDTKNNFAEMSPHDILGIPGGSGIATKQEASNEKSNENISSDVFSLLGVKNEPSQTPIASEKVTSGNDGFEPALSDILFETVPNTDNEVGVGNTEENCTFATATDTVVNPLEQLLMDPFITEAIKTCCNVCEENGSITVKSEYGVVVSIVNNYIAMNNLQGITAISF